MNLSRDIARLAADIGAAAFGRICERLDSAQAGVTARAALTELDADLAPWAAAALRAITEHESRPDVLALGFRCAADAVQTTRARLGESVLVWSGPDGGLASVRSLEQALRDLILGAERELWLVSFAAFRFPHLHAALHSAAERNVRLHFLLETAADSAGALSVDARAAFPADLLAASRLYAWPLEKRPRNAAGNPAKLHSKFAVADRRTALISSANLTADAFERNMEAGVVVQGGPLPVQLAEHLDQLVALGSIRTPCI